MASCQKLGIILVINGFKNWFYQKMSITTNVLLNWYSSMKKKIQKDSDDFWHRKLTLKVKFWYFLTAPHYSNFQNLVISFEYSWFLAKNLSNFVSLPWKLHNRECHILQSHSYNWDSNSAKGDFFRDFDLSFMVPESTAFSVSNWFFRMFMIVGLEIPYSFITLALSNPGFFESSIIWFFLSNSIFFFEEFLGF